MWKLFKRKTPRISLIHVLFERGSNIMERKHRGLANVLNKKVARWSTSRIKIAMILFITIYVASIVYLLVDTFSTNTDNIQVDHIYVPKNVSLKDTQNRSLDEENKFIRVRIKEFYLYMDSLKNDTNGKHIYDSIIHYRPGLLDSITYWESLNNQK
ncbi:hypothetical protein ACDQ55_15260 [Chitinophaga sp. 30R24]|uniref:hypothetical protein n=1 Tax=Chitinophaga sp. 30R24 TaxID=3248838 RepID=UPI003B904D46